MTESFDSLCTSAERCIGEIRAAIGRREYRAAQGKVADLERIKKGLQVRITEMAGL